MSRMVVRRPPASVGYWNVNEYCFAELRVRVTGYGLRVRVAS